LSYVCLGARDRKAEGASTFLWPLRLLSPNNYTADRFCQHASLPSPGATVNSRVTSRRAGLRPRRTVRPRCPCKCSWALGSVFLGSLETTTNQGRPSAEQFLEARRLIGLLVAVLDDDRSVEREAQFLASTLGDGARAGHDDGPRGNHERPGSAGVLARSRLGRVSPRLWSV